MKLYKYKSLSNFEFVADILINNQLYAANIKELNDPMEGSFYCYNGNESYYNLINQELDELRVCSLSITMNSPILWAHYADNFKGICIEIEIDETILEIHKINYSPMNPIPSENYKGLLGDEEELTPYNWALASLNHKYEEWAYEHEYRLLSNKNIISDGFKITKIYFGIRTSKIYKDIITKLVSSDIEIKDTLISDGNEVIPELIW
jgi:hypothetical protein